MLAILMAMLSGLATTGAPDRVVFASTRDGGSAIYLATLDGRALQRLTRGGGGDGFPRCSPTGRGIAFVRGQDAQSEVWVLDLDTLRERRISPPGDASHTPAWSGDGRRVIFTRKVGDHERLSSVRPDGAGLRDITRAAWHDVMPGPSPDGRALVFHSYRHGPKNSEIYLRRLSDGVERRLTRSDGMDYEAAFSRDGGKVFFSSNRQGGPWRIFEHDLASGTERLVAAVDGDAWGARHGPAGLLFYAGRSGAWRPYLLADGQTTPQPLWNGAIDASGLDWCKPQSR